MPAGKLASHPGPYAYRDIYVAKYDTFHFSECFGGWLGRDMNVAVPYGRPAGCPYGADRQRKNIHDSRQQILKIEYLNPY